MSAPLFGTDPLDGINFGFGQRLRSPCMSTLLQWERNLDSALEHQIAVNWATGGAGHAGSDAIACSYDSSTDHWITVGDDGAGGPDTANASDGIWFTPVAPPGGNLVALACVASDGAGRTVAGGNAGANADKYCWTVNDGAAWTLANSTSAAAHHIRTICWAPTVGLFVAGSVASGGVPIIETSATGATGTWTARAIPGACGAYSWIASAANDAGLTVLVPSDVGATNFATSPDGAIWTARVVPADTWKAVAYAHKSGNWLAAGDATLAQSADAITWSAGTAVPPVGMTATYGLASTGNLFVLHWSGGVGEQISVSNDWGATWRTVVQITLAGLATANSLIYGRGADSGGRLMLGYGSNTRVSYRGEI